MQFRKIMTKWGQHQDYKNLQPWKTIKHVYDNEFIVLLQKGFALSYIFFAHHVGNIEMA